MSFSAGFKCFLLTTIYSYFVIKWHLSFILDKVSRLSSVPHSKTLSNLRNMSMAPFFHLLQFFNILLKILISWPISQGHLQKSKTSLSSSQYFFHTIKYFSSSLFPSDWTVVKNLEEVLLCYEKKIFRVGISGKKFCKFNKVVANYRHLKSQTINRKSQWTLIKHHSASILDWKLYLSRVYFSPTKTV